MQIDLEGDIKDGKELKDYRSKDMSCQFKSS